MFWWHFSSNLCKGVEINDEMIRCSSSGHAGQILWWEPSCTFNKTLLSIKSLDLLPDMGSQVKTSSMNGIKNLICQVFNFRTSNVLARTDIGSNLFYSTIGVQLKELPSWVKALKNFYTPQCTLYNFNLLILFLDYPLFWQKSFLQKYIFITRTEFS